MPCPRGLDLPRASRARQPAVEGRLSSEGLGRTRGLCAAAAMRSALLAMNEDPAESKRPKPGKQAEWHKIPVQAPRTRVANDRDD